MLSRMQSAGVHGPEGGALATRTFRPAARPRRKTTSQPSLPLSGSCAPANPTQHHFMNGYRCRDKYGKALSARMKKCCIPAAKRSVETVDEIVAVVLAGVY